MGSAGPADATWYMTVLTTSSVRGMEANHSHVHKLHNTESQKLLHCEAVSHYPATQEDEVLPRTCPEGGTPYW